MEAATEETRVATPTVLLDEAVLALALTLSVSANDAVVDLDDAFGSSVLWWENGRKLVQLPDYHFSFLLAVNDATMSIAEIRDSLTYFYVNGLQLGRKSVEFEASQSTAHARARSLRRVALNSDADTLETLLCAAYLRGGRAAWVARQHATRKRYRDEGLGYGDDDDDDDDGDDHEESLYRLFRISRCPAGAYDTSVAAFKSVFQVHCRNHVVAATVIYTLLPYGDGSGSSSSSSSSSDAKPVTNPSSDDRRYGRMFFRSNNRRALGYLVHAITKSAPRTLAVIPGGEDPRATAVQQMTRAFAEPFLGTERRIVPCAGRPLPPLPYPNARALLICPAGTPFRHPVLGHRPGLRSVKLNVPVHIQPPASDEPSRYASHVVRVDDLHYLGELGTDCATESHYTNAVTASATKTKSSTTTTTTKRRPKRDVSWLTDLTDGMTNAKRLKTIRGTLDYRAFVQRLKSVDAGTRASVPLLERILINQADFIEVLSHQPDLEGLSAACVFTCRDLIVRRGLFTDHSSVVSRLDAHLHEATAAGTTYPRIAWGDYYNDDNHE